MERIQGTLSNQDLNPENAINLAKEAQQIVDGQKSLKDLKRDEQRAKFKSSDKPDSIRFAMDDFSMKDVIESQSLKRAEDSTALLKENTLKATDQKVKQMMESFIANSGVTIFKTSGR